MEAAQGDLEHERKQHQSTKDGSQQIKEQLLGQIKDVQDKLVDLVRLKTFNGYNKDHQVD